MNKLSKIQSAEIQSNQRTTTMAQKYFNLNSKIICTKKLTSASLAVEESLATGFFCFKKFPEFKIGPDTLRREVSVEVKPTGRPSSSPISMLEKPKV